jgi:predicted phosphodiesterase
LLFGHTHVPHDEMIGGVRWYNPGSAGLANKGAPLSLALLTKQGTDPFQVNKIRLA